MKILFFSREAPTSFDSNAYNGGGWISSFISQMMKVDSIDIGFGALQATKVKPDKKSKVKVYTIAEKFNSGFDKLSLFLGADYAKKEAISCNYYMSQLKDIVSDFQPDIIHVFGSENIFGLVSLVTDIPVVIHIQGILNPYLNAYFPPEFSWKNSHLGLKCFYDTRMTRIAWLRQCWREERILQATNYYFGRTTWDHRISKLYSPKSTYFKAWEILRPPFYIKGERNIPKQLRIVTTISNPLYKGYDLILKTARLLKEKLHLDFEWTVFGNINPRVVESKLKLYHDKLNVSLYGVASPEEIKNIILGSTIYFHPSYIDNSPNSVCEAQILGCTVIATNVGGVSSLIDDGRTGFLIPANDPYQAAALIDEIYANPEHNKRIGADARKTALQRHNPQRIINDVIENYKTIINQSHNTYKQN